MEKPSNPVASPGEGFRESTARAARVLVVEDQRHLSRFFQFVLESAGYDVRVAYDGEQALAAVEAFRPDALLLDLVLPGMSGREVLRCLRANHIHKDLAIVMLLSSCNPSLCVELREAGANSHCTKPIAPGTLLEKLEEVSVPARRPQVANRHFSAER